jgi:para-aminobenzoate synthetase/4-amino-4-deoxychorismate lyase
MDRLKSEADSLGYNFDRHEARNELQAATFGKRHAAVARLLLSPAGSLAIEIRPA